MFAARGRIAPAAGAPASEMRRGATAAWNAAPAPLAPPISGSAAGERDGFGHDLGRLPVTAPGRGTAGAAGPVGTASAAPIQRVRGKLNSRQVSRYRTNDTTWGRATVGSKRLPKKSSGFKASHLPKGEKLTKEETKEAKDEVNAAFAQKMVNLGYKPPPKNPHAEDRLIKAAHKRGGHQGFASVALDKAPCKRCAKNLVRFAGGKPLRVKASRINTEGEEGIKVLKKANVPFRVWTDAQRDVSKSVQHNATSGALKAQVERLHAEKPENRWYRDRVENTEADDLRKARVHYPDAAKKWSAQGASRADLLAEAEGSDAEEEAAEVSAEEEAEVVKVTAKRRRSTASSSSRKRPKTSKKK